MEDADYGEHEYMTMWYRTHLLVCIFLVINRFVRLLSGCVCLSE